MKLIFSEHAWEDYLFWQDSFAGYWSRRITDEHRIVYKVEDDALHLAQLRYHY